MNNIVVKECSKHGLTEFVLTSEGYYKCKKCRSEAVSSKRRENKLRLIEYKGGKCEICGYNKCVEALEFHHLNPSEKEIPIGCGNTVSFEKLKKEVDKCMLLCSNCHKEIHSKINAKILFEKKENERQNIEEYKKTHNIRNKIVGTIPKNEIIELTKSMTQKEIAEKYGISISTVKRILKS